MNQKGRRAECILSSVIHPQGTCLLVDPLFLRSHNSGQIDLSYLAKDTLYLFECKSNLGIPKKQRIRILSSAIILSKILSLEVKVLLFSSKDGCFYPVFQH